MKFRETAKSYFKQPEMTDIQLLAAMKALDRGKQTRFFDKANFAEDDKAAQQAFSTALLSGKENNPKQTPYDIYKAIATSEKSKVFETFKSIEQQLTESSDWKAFWQDKNDPEDLSLKQNLINAYRFAIIQNLYVAAAIATTDKKVMDKIKLYVKNIENLSNEYERNRFINIDATPVDPIIKDLDAYIARKSKPTTLKRVKTLGRTASISPEMTFMHTKGDGEKTKIAKDLKATLLETKDDKIAEKLEALEKRYNKIQNDFGSTTLRDCLDRILSRKLRNKINFPCYSRINLTTD